MNRLVATCLQFWGIEGSKLLGLFLCLRYIIEKRNAFDISGVLVVDLKWRNKTYSGSLIDHSRYGWANPRYLFSAFTTNFRILVPTGEERLGMRQQ